MAYPGEREHKRYMDYVLAESEEGREPLKKEEWRRKVNDGDAGKMSWDDLRVDKVKGNRKITTR